ncbi:substrate-binding periplasmic protein [Chitinibacter tainanensis]|uniref:substrate-binding periplasmic protein n=1 Tax=Chitinibacter tainanensis TaxID=230667 RepID=UPI00068624BD|nr:transporter substrate-binding domain-containing protein [Chitinibacter tainanensis]
MSVFRLLLCWLGISCLSATSSWAASVVPIYTHYDYPPFLTAKQGLSRDLADELTRRSQGRYQFVVQLTPRKRLDLLLAQPNWQGVVPWVNPQWFPTTQGGLWSEMLFLDADLVISRKPLQYSGPASLTGLTLGGILGHHYVELSDALNSGQLQRDDAPNQESNLRKLASGRVDVIFVPQSSWGDYQHTNPGLIEGLSVARQPRNHYPRQLLVSERQPALAQFVLTAVRELNADPAWQQKLAPYRFANPR